MNSGAAALSWRTAAFLCVRWAETLGVKITDESIVTNQHMRTSIPQVYAAGDGLNQIATTIGNAAVAATAVRNELRC
jgi:thioredoxin reductase (NADPH)